MMIKLTHRKWKTFRLYDVFNHSRGKRQVEKSRIDGSIPYYSATQSNNGLTDFISNPGFTVNTNAIIYSTFGDAYYVESGFSASDEITVLTNPNLNKYIGLFICRLIQQNKSRYSFGRKAFSNKIGKDKIMLPVTIEDESKPDWDFMESYSKERYEEKETTYQEYVKKIIKQLEYREIVSLEEKNWKDFFLTDLFMTIQRGKRLTRNSQIEGYTPYISSSSFNNGIDNFVSNRERARVFSDCLTVANSGSVGASFYQPYEFVASDHVTHLKNKAMNKYIYLFIATITSRLSNKYNFNREISDKRMSREKVMLPVNNKDEPDFAYMEQYVKNNMFKKYSKYLKLNR